MQLELWDYYELNIKNSQPLSLSREGIGSCKEGEGEGARDKSFRRVPDELEGGGRCLREKNDLVHSRDGIVPATRHGDVSAQRLPVPSTSANRRPRNS